MRLQGRNAERRLVTILFADLSNFTAMCHELDPEESVKIANICFEHINSIVEGNGGMIHKYEGDAVMCLFGFPVTYEDAPERAVKTGLELVEKMPEINGSVYKETGIECDLGMHIGIHSGLAVVAEVGSEAKKEYTVMGNTVNLASRLKDTALTGTILVSEPIFKATQYLFEYRKAESFSIKGLDGQIKLFQPLKLRKISGTKRGIKGLHSPMVGREEEFEIIKGMIQGLTEGHSSILFVTGDAGIGKSRLWQEAKNFIDDENLGIRVLEGQCLYHGEHLSYWPILQILEQVYDITDSDDSDVIKRKIITKTREILPARWEDVAPYIGQLFSVTFTDKLAERVKYLNPQDLQIKILGGIKILLSVISRKTPVLVCIEDYHWIDSASLEFFQFMFGSVGAINTPNILLLCLTRDRKEGDGFRVKEELKQGSVKDIFTELKLEPLDNYSSLELTYNLLEIPGFTKEFKDKLLAKAEGNPFFLEEIINSFIESGVLFFEGGMWKLAKKVEEIEIPDTIQLVIAARLDRLEEDLRRVLQMASVIGRTFYESILAQIHQDKKHLKEYLRSLEEYEFILKLISGEQVLEDIEYMFKHPLMQQVTYRSLLKTERKKLHRRVAESMEELYKNRSDDFVGLIAQQYASSDDYGKAVQWLLKAGKKAKETYANQDALDYYQKIISIIAENGISDRGSLVKAYESIADILNTLGRNEESIRNYEKILKISDDGLTQVRIIRKIGDTYQRQSMYPEALEYLKKSKAKLIEVFEKSDNDQNKDKYYIQFHTINHSLAWVNYLMGDFHLAQDYCEKSLAEISNIADEKERDRTQASTLNVMAAIKSRTGQSEESYRCYLEAEKIYAKQDDLPGLGTIYNNIVNYFSEKGDFISCINYLEKSLDIAVKTGNALSEAITSFNLGHEYLNLGKYDMARMYFDRYQKLNRLINNRLGEGWANEGYSSMYSEQGNNAKAIECIDTAIAIFQEVGSKIKEVGAKLSKADLLVDSGQFDEADRLLKQVETYAVEHSVTNYLASIHITRGRLNLEKGKTADALVEFAKAQDMVKEMGWLSALSDIYYYMGQTRDREGNREESKKFFDMARKHLKENADNITDEDLRQSFLAKSFNKKIQSA